MQKPASPVLETQNLQSTPTIFKASDMRLFHHFLMIAYPHLPLGNDSVWVRDIPTFSHSVSLYKSFHFQITVCSPEHIVRFPHASHARPLRLPPNAHLHLPPRSRRALLPHPRYQRPQRRALYTPNLQRKRRRHPGNMLGPLVPSYLSRRIC